MRERSDRRLALPSMSRYRFQRMVATGNPGRGRVRLGPVLGGALRGHPDGIIIHGPDLGIYLTYPLIWEHKCLNAKSWHKVERDGLEKKYPHYLAQVSLYQAYLDVTNPALFTVTNADTCEWLHFFVPFNAERAQLWSDRAVNIIEATRAGTGGLSTVGVGSRSRSRRLSVARRRRSRCCT